MALVQLLYRLQVTDQEWDEKARRYRSVKQSLTDHSEQEAKREEQKRLVEQLATLRTELCNAELELDSLSAKASGVEKELYSGTVSSPKELDNLRKESEQLERRVSQLEDHVLDTMSKVDALDAAAQQGQKKMETLEAEWTRNHRELIQEYKTLRGQLQTLQQDREQLRGRLDQPALVLYDELRKTKAGRALAPIKDGVCQICRVTVPNAKTRRVQEGKIVATCEGCGRILYQE